MCGNNTLLKYVSKLLQNYANVNKKRIFSYLVSTHTIYIHLEGFENLNLCN